MKKIVLPVVLGLALACAAKPTPKPVVEDKPLDYVDYADAKEALETAAERDRARADLQVKELAWQKTKAKLIEKYGIDPDLGHGWDPDEKGRLKARRAQLRTTAVR